MHFASSCVAAVLSSRGSHHRPGRVVAAQHSLSHKERHCSVRTRHQRAHQTLCSALYAHRAVCCLPPAAHTARHAAHFPPPIDSPIILPGYPRNELEGPDQERRAGTCHQTQHALQQQANKEYVGAAIRQAEIQHCTPSRPSFQPSPPTFAPMRQLPRFFKHALT